MFTASSLNYIPNRKHHLRCQGTNGRFTHCFLDEDNMAWLKRRWAHDRVVELNRGPVFGCTCSRSSINLYALFGLLLNVVTWIVFQKPSCQNWDIYLRAPVRTRRRWILRTSKLRRGLLWILLLSSGLLWSHYLGSSDPLTHLLFAGCWLPNGRSKGYSICKT